MSVSQKMYGAKRTSRSKHGQDLLDALYDLWAVVDYTIAIEQERIDRVYELSVLFWSLKEWWCHICSFTV
jgi:hypothetical protein